METAAFNMLDDTLGYSLVVQGVTLIIATKNRIGPIPDFNVDDDVLLLGFLFGVKTDKGPQSKITDSYGGFTDASGVALFTNTSCCSHALNFSRFKHFTHNNTKEITIGGESRSAGEKNY